MCVHPLNLCVDSAGSEVNNGAVVCTVSGVWVCILVWSSSSWVNLGKCYKLLYLSFLMEILIVSKSRETAVIIKRVNTYNTYSNAWHIVCTQQLLAILLICLSRSVD